MDYDAHWQAMYDTLAAGLTAAGLTEVTLVAVHSQDTQTAGSSVEPPYVIYTQERETGMGTFGGGQNEVAESGWLITARARDLQEVLDIATAIVGKLELEDIADTTDGYSTTAVEVVGVQTLWEIDSKLHALLMRFNWERAK